MSLRGPRHGWRAAALILVLVVLALVAAVGRDARKAPYAMHRPVFLFAVDGLEWRIVAPLLAEGRLPTLERLMARGRFGYLKSLVPTMSPAIWTSIATGKRPKKHGILGFVHDAVEHGRRHQRYYTSHDRRTKAIWNILSDYGLSSILIGWWTTYPAESIRGVMVSQTNTTKALQGLLRKGTLVDGVAGQVHPAEYQDAVFRVLAEVDAQLPDVTTRIFGAIHHRPGGLTERLWKETQWAIRADVTYARLAKKVLARHPEPDFFAVYFGGTDVVGHRFWRYAFPEEFADPPHPDSVRVFGRVIDDYYRWVDRTIGELLAGQPDDVTVLVVSDHGMHGVNRRARFSRDVDRHLINSGHHEDGPPGVFIATGPGIVDGPGTASRRKVDPRSLEIVASVLGITPTVLALKGIPRGLDMDGHPPWGLLDAAIRRREFFHVVRSHDEPGWRPATAPTPPVDEEERLQQLRALGYVE